MSERLLIINPESLGSEIPSRDEREERTIVSEWWFTPHPLILNNTPEVMREINPLLQAELLALTGNLYSQFAQEYFQRNCPTILWDEGSMYEFWNQDRLYQPSVRPISHAVIVNPVFLGTLPEEVVSTLSDLRSQKPPFYDDSSQGFKQILREYLPERALRRRQLPLIAQIGKKICKSINVEKELRLHPNFTNMIFIEDEGEDIKNLPYHWQQHFGWSMMAKLGTFKSIIVLYRSVDSQLGYDFILNSLEGAHPLLRPEQLPRRLMAFGSAKEMGDWKQLSGVEIPLRTWRELPEVKSLINFSRFCGDKELLSPPVRIRTLVRSRWLGRLEERLAGFSRQAEGAFIVFVPYKEENFNALLNLPWTGFHLATISGKFGALKTKLQGSDFAAVGAFYKDGLMGIIPVEEIKTRGPSVESYELIDSQNELTKESPAKFLYRLKRAKGGDIISPDGSIIVPGWRGALHFHRDYEIRSPDKVISIPIDREKFPPFPCGSDRTHALSKYALRKALELWEAGGRKAVCALVEIPNHGVHAILFWTANEQGIIPENPVELFEEAIKREWLVFKPEVKQG